MTLVRYVAFTTSFTLLRRIKLFNITSLMTTLMARILTLLFGLLSAESPENIYLYIYSS